MALEQLSICTKKKKTKKHKRASERDLSAMLPLHQTAKFHSTQIKDFNVRARTMMIQQENTGENLCGIALGQDFFNRTQKHEPSKKRLLKWTSVLRACALQKAHGEENKKEG